MSEAILEVSEESTEESTEEKYDLTSSGGTDLPILLLCWGIPDRMVLQEYIIRTFICVLGLISKKSASKSLDIIRLAPSMASCLDQ